MTPPWRRPPGLARAFIASKALLVQRDVVRDDQLAPAGAFGSHIDVKYAMVLGMIPDCDLSQVSSAGNAAGTGARIALLDLGSRKTIETLVHNVEKVETAIEPRFQSHFVEAMGIPHSTAPYPNLRKAVSLPAPKAPAPRAGARGARRRAASPRRKSLSRGEAYKEESPGVKGVFGSFDDLGAMNRLHRVYYRDCTEFARGRGIVAHDPLPQEMLLA